MQFQVNFKKFQQSLQVRPSKWIVDGDLDRANFQSGHYQVGEITAQCRSKIKLDHFQFGII